MGLLVLIDDEEIERKTFFTICTDRHIAEEQECIGVPTPEALISLVRANSIPVEDIGCIFVDLQLKPNDQLDRGGLTGADILRQELGNIPIIAYTRHTELWEFADITSHEFDGILLKQDCADAWRFTEERFRRLIAGWRRKRGLHPEMPKVGKAHKSFANPVILHLSDLQFGRASQRPRDLADSIISAASNNSLPNIVVISGDVAQTGSPTEYEAALIFLQRLCMGLKIREDQGNRVIICPGNHDVNWTLSLGAYVDQHLERRLNPLLEDSAFRYRMAPYYDFCAEFYGAPPGSGLLHGEEGVRIFDLREYGVVFVSLNSSCQEDPFRKNGILRQEVFEQVDDHLRSLGDLTNLACFAVMHHPLQVGAGSGVSTSPNDLVGDPTGVARRLWSSGISAIFTGHIHASSFEFVPVEAGTRVRGSGILNFLAGSAGVPELDRPNIGESGHIPNEFSILRGIRTPSTWHLEAFSYDVASRAFLPKPKFVGFSYVREVELPPRE